MNATKRFRARLHEVTQQWLRELVAEVVAAHTPAPGRGGRFRRRVAAAGKLTTSVLASAVSPRKVKRRAPKQAPQREPLVPPPAPSNESSKPEPAAPKLPVSPSSPAVEEAEVITPPLPAVIVSSPAKRWGLPTRASALRQPNPAGAPALMGAPKAPLVGAGRGRSEEELRAVHARGGKAAHAAMATARALGPTPKLSKSDRELEAWAAERLAAGDLPAEMTIPRDELDEPAALAPAATEDEEDEG